MKKNQWNSFLWSIIITIGIINIGFSQFSDLTVIEEASATNSIGSSLEDIDNDGDFDVISRYKNATYWFENDGSGHFSTYQEFMRFVNSENRLYAFVDIDGDSVKDFVMGKYWKKGLGDGEYKSKESVFSNMISLMSDVDDDGLVDALYLSNSKVYWQKNMGGGSFRSAQVLINENLSIYQVFDINQDDKDDLIVGKDGQLFCYLNNSGSYHSTKILDFVPTSYLVKDFNFDGVVDLVAAHSGKIIWYELNNNGEATLKQTISNLYGNGGLSMGDLDYDGQEDLFVGNIVEPFARARYFHFGNSGLFDTLALNHSNYLSKYGGSMIADLDGDGHNDLFINQHSISKASWLKNISAGFFKGAYPIQKIYNRSSKVFSFDTDGDLDDDIWTDHFLFENLGDGQFKRSIAPNVFGYQNLHADLNGDTLDDVVFPQGDSIYWKMNLGNNVYSNPIVIDALLPMCHAVSGGDFDGDGDIDLIAGHWSDLPGNLYLFRNDGLGHFNAEEILSNIGKMNQIDVMDGDGDGDIDFEIFINEIPFFFSNSGNASFQYSIFNFPYEPESWPFVSNKSQSLIIDLDGDGFRDYIVSNQKTSKTQTIWYRYLGNGNIGEKKVLLEKRHQGSYSNMYFTVFDANLDGILDVVISHSYDKQLFYLRGLGNGVFADEVMILDEPGYGNLGGVTAADIDGDGKKEVVFADNIGGFDRLAYLKNITGVMKVVSKSAICDNNGTSKDTTDDRVLLKIEAQSPSQSNRYKLSFANGITTDIDTLWYDTLTVVTLSNGSAGDDDIIFKIQDLEDKTQFLWYSIANPGTCSVVSNANLDELNSVKIYPNPSNGIINILNSIDASILVYDIFGKLIYFKDDILPAEQIVLDEGIYFFKILSKKGTMTKSVIISK